MSQDQFVDAEQLKILFSDVNIFFTNEEWIFILHKQSGMRSFIIANGIFNWL